MKKSDSKPLSLATAPILGQPPRLMGSDITDERLFHQQRHFLVFDHFFDWLAIINGIFEHPYISVGYIAFILVAFVHYVDQ
ncbi:MAG: hypothetical protein ACI9D5_001786 [Candidatus Endobugula sp.]|jgi:hypothetical protein